MKREIVERNGAGVAAAGLAALACLPEDVGDRRLLGDPDVHDLVPPEARRAEVHPPEPRARDDEERYERELSGPGRGMHRGNG
jgi:hypothetical protein